MRHRINEKVVLLCMPKGGPDGPIAPYLYSFAQSLSEQGYSRCYLRRQVMLAACFSRWLKQRHVRSCCISSEHPARYLRCRYRERQATEGDSGALDHLMAFLRAKRVFQEKKSSAPPPIPAERCAQHYERYLRQDRALAQATVINYVPFIVDFLKDRFGAGPVKLSALRLAAAVPIVASWSMASIPRAISREQTKKLLASIDRKTAVGRRDYAILLLLARLGVRSGEVASLELDDIDWSAGQLSVRSKGGRRSELPLPPEVGRAITAYLRHGRPQCPSRRVFVRVKAPVRGFQGAGGVGSIVRHRLKRASITAPTYGAHQFRHGLASDMLRQGASLAEIGAVLGHHHPDTTRIYTKIDLKALHTLAQPWPPGVR